MHRADDEDLHLALYCCYELHYRGLDAVDDGWEWEPSLIGARRVFEERFETELRDAVGPPDSAPAADEMDVALREIAMADEGGPSVSQFVERAATREQVLEFVVHRSAYQLKEADPHSWALPRLWGPPKAALVEIQADEYGEDAPTASTPRCSRGRWRPSGWIPPTGPTSTGSPRRCSRRST